MKLLDLFCGAGGAGKGYQMAGFDVVGVDLKPQKNYPFEFHQGDALEFLLAHGHEFDAIHASPPCQRYCAMTKRWGPDAIEKHPDLVDATRRMLIESGKPYVIENVVGSPLIDPIMLCGTMFSLGTSFGSQLRRHRLFESNAGLTCEMQCAHNDGSAIGVYGGGQHPNRRVPATVGAYGSTGPGAYSTRDGTCGFGVNERREAMGIDWMTGKELSQAIPPAYTEFVGRQLMQAVLRELGC